MERGVLFRDEARNAHIAWAPRGPSVFQRVWAWLCRVAGGCRLSSENGRMRIELNTEARDMLVWFGILSMLSIVFGSLIYQSAHSRRASIAAEQAIKQQYVTSGYCETYYAKWVKCEVIQRYHLSPQP